MKSLKQRLFDFNDYMKQQIVSEMTPEETEYDERLRKTEIRNPKLGCLICLIPVVILIISLVIESLNK